MLYREIIAVCSEIHTEHVEVWSKNRSLKGKYSSNILPCDVKLYNKNGLKDKPNCTILTALQSMYRP